MPHPLTHLPLVLIGLTTLALGGCASEQALPDGASACPTPLPRMCTMDFRPVQGFDANGHRVGGFSNHCRACAQKGVTCTLPQDPD